MLPARLSRYNMYSQVLSTHGCCVCWRSCAFLYLRCVSCGCISVLSEFVRHMSLASTSLSLHALCLKLLPPSPSMLYMCLILSVLNSEFRRQCNDLDNNLLQTLCDIRQIPWGRDIVREKKYTTFEHIPKADVEQLQSLGGLIIHYFSVQSDYISKQLTYR